MADFEEAKDALKRIFSTKRPLLSDYYKVLECLELGELVIPNIVVDECKSNQVIINTKKRYILYGKGIDEQTLVKIKEKLKDEK